MNVLSRQKLLNNILVLDMILGHLFSLSQSPGRRLRVLKNQNLNFL